MNFATKCCYNGKRNNRKGVSEINMNDVAGIIFSNLHDRSIPELTGKRTMGAIPFGGKYRMVDFPLSAMANAGIRNISVIAHHNYESLVEHIGNGSDWGIPTDRGGVKIISPYMTAYAKSDERYTSRLDSLKSICNNLERMKEKYIVMCDCDCLLDIDINDMVKFHISRRACITVNSSEKLFTDQNGRIINMDQSFSNPFDLNVNVWVFDKEYLVGMVKNAISRHHDVSICDIICKNIGNCRFFEYDCGHEILRIKSLTDYFKTNMKLLSDFDFRKSIFDGFRCKKDTCLPTSFGGGAFVSSSLIAEGCNIDGKVENSIVFSGVKIEKDAFVKNSILLPNVRISAGAMLDFVVVDKNADIGGDYVLSGCKILPYFISSEKIV